MSASTVKITNAHKYYNRGKGNELHVMDNISLELPESGMIAVFGQSGCGKTTLLNAIGGLDKIASGKIELFGKDIRQDTDTVRNRYIGYIFQNYNLNVTETVYENVAAALRLCGMDNEIEIADRVTAALENVDMAKYRDRTPDTLSGGQQQRVAIARALVKNPAIILADEPTGNLDETNTVMVMDILKEISRTHLVILVTHEANLVDYYCDRVIEIVDGRVNSQRENRNANGYVQRNKNDIFLGELTRTETSTPGVKIEYYGEPTQEITLRVVNAGGKLYLKSDTPSVKILDEGSEIKLREGVFEAAPAEGGKKNGRHLDMSHLAPVEGKNFGRLYHWRNSLSSAWRENFSKKQKKGKGLLRACLFLLSVVMVFMTAVIGAGISSYADLREQHNDRLFYIPLDPNGDYAAISEAMGTNGMDYARIIGGSPLYDTDYLSFKSQTFMTADAVTLYAEGRAQDIRYTEGMTVVAGTATPESSADIVLTTALADEMLEGSTVSYLDEYSDLVGMISNRTYSAIGDVRLRIVGVVESDERNFYMDSLTLAQYILDNYFWFPVSPVSSVDYEGELKAGELVYIDSSMSGASVALGDKVQMLGRTFVVSDVVKSYISIFEYPTYVYDTYGVKLITDASSYYEELVKTEPDVDFREAEYRWLLDYYYAYIPAFYATMVSARQPYEEITFEEWAIAKKQSIAAYATEMGYDPYTVCGAYLYHAENGTYPTEDELNAYMSTEDFPTAVEPLFDLYYDGSSAYSEYDSFMNAHYNGSKSEYYYIVSDEDYVALATGAGKTDGSLSLSTYNVYDQYDGSMYYTNHLMIRSSDPAATEAFLHATLGAEAVITPDEVFDEMFDEVRTTVIIGVVCILAVLALMCLCVYFIMRSSFMSRVREVGILRAIGVTKRNLVFRFAVETALLISLTLVVGYLLSAWFIASLSGAALFASIFYFPFWLGAGLLIVICAVAMIFGILPALLLLRRTPSEILSKYDI